MTRFRRRLMFPLYVTVVSSATIVAAIIEAVNR